MQKINIEDIEYIAMGSTVLGTGGGGDPYIGKLFAKEAMKKYGEVALIKASELEDDALVVPIAAFGAPMILVEKLFSGDEFIKKSLSTFRQRFTHGKSCLVAVIKSIASG